MHTHTNKPMLITHTFKYKLLWFAKIRQKDYSDDNNYTKGDSCIRAASMNIIPFLSRHRSTTAGVPERDALRCSFAEQVMRVCPGELLSTGAAL